MPFLRSVRFAAHGFGLLHRLDSPTAVAQSSSMKRNPVSRPLVRSVATCCELTVRGNPYC